MRRRCGFLLRSAGLERGSSVAAGPFFPAASTRRAEDLEVPRPLRLMLTAGWNLTESVGLPVAAYVAAAWLDGRDAGLVGLWHKDRDAVTHSYGAPRALVIAIP